MIEIGRLLANMRLAIQSAGFPNAVSVASQLGLDLSSANVTETDKGLVSVVGALLSTSPVGVVAAVAPRRRLDLIFIEPSVSIKSCLARRLEFDQRIEPSKHGAGIAILFSRDGLDCGVTASGMEGVIETLFCQAVK